jgi:3-oxoacyl-[acyl-carrier protein] reductase
LAFDVADRAATRAALEPLLQERCPDALVYNSGIARDNLLAFMQDAEWDDVLRTNLDGFFNVAKPVVFEMIRRKRGRIVVISSYLGPGGTGRADELRGLQGRPDRCGPALAREVGRKNVFVNVVAPGVIETEMTADLPKEHVLPLIPLNRYGTAAEVAAVVDFLCSEPHMYVHGQVIGVNGGMAI